MTGFIKKNRFACFLLLAGLICSLILCARRAELEAGNRLVCAVMTAEDAEVLSYIPGSLRLFDGGNTLDGAVLLVEDENQYSYVPMSGTEYEPGNSVRCFKLIEKYAARYAYLGYDGAQEIENILYRAVTERNIRVVWLTPFTDSRTGSVITDGKVYEDVIQGLSERISPHGLTMSDGGFSVFPEYEPNKWLLCGALLGILGAALLVIGSVFENRKISSTVFLLFCAGLTFLILFMKPRTAAPALAAACLFPCLSMLSVTVRLKSTGGGSLGKKLASYCKTILPAFFTALLGGLFVAAMQSSSEYMLSVENFRGVKLSQTVPLCFAAVIIYLRLYGRDGMRDILSGKKTLIALLVIAVLGVLAVFLMRTGDGLLSVGTLEQRFRNLLERVLITRPRTKEFIVAWPCLALACALAAAGAKRWLWPFTLVSTIGFSSVVNTFCHSRAPVWLSCVRSVLGLAAGLAIGMIVICIADLFSRKKN